MFFELNYGYYIRVFYEDETNSYLKFYLTDKLDKKLINLILIWQKNLLYGQNSQKQANNQYVKA